MARSPRENVALTKRRETVAELYLQAWTQAAIASQLGVSQSTVSADLSVVQRQWRDSAIRDFDGVRDFELRKLDRVEREAWAAWERSQKPSQSAVMSTDGSEQKTQKVVKEQHGDPRFLDQVMKCIASRRALLGLDAPTRVESTSSVSLSSGEQVDAVLKQLEELAAHQGVKLNGRATWMD